MAVVDSTFLILLFDGREELVLDESTGHRITSVQARIEQLVADLTKSGATLLIPAPALSEALVGVKGSVDEYINVLATRSVFKIVPFGTRAAVEAAELTRTAMLAGGKLVGANGGWQKVKVDRQILGIAKAEGQSVIYSQDLQMSITAKNAGLRVVSIADLPLPPSAAQINLLLPDPQPAKN